jgi:hypothetical protein
LRQILAEALAKQDEQSPQDSITGGGNG